jgi:hypothetical protein
MKRKSSIILTLNSASAESGFSKEKLRTALKAAGVDYGPGKTFTIKQLLCAFIGDFRHESTLLKRAKRKDAELELELKNNNLIPREDVRDFITSTFLPHVQLVKSMPGALCALVNPSDPQHARAHLDRFVLEFVALKMHLPESAVEGEKWTKAQQSGAPQDSGATQQKETK